MKSNILQKRRDKSRKRGMKVLYASLGFRKQQVAATAPPDEAEVEGNVPNLNVSRALIVILALHVVAAGCMVVHSKYFDKGEPVQVASVDKGSVAVPSMLDEHLSKLEEGENGYYVVTGDRYETIAERQGVDLQELRKLNQNMPLRAGRLLRIPPRRVVAQEPAELTALRARENAGPDPRGNVENIARNVNAPRVQLVRPTRPHVISNSSEADNVVPRAVPVSESLSQADLPDKSTKSHVVQQGDNLWRIAKKYGVDEKSLMKANGITDARKLKLGATLKIPARVTN